MAGSKDPAVFVFGYQGLNVKDLKLGEYATESG